MRTTLFLLQGRFSGYKYNDEEDYAYEIVEELYEPAGVRKKHTSIMKSLPATYLWVITGLKIVLFSGSWIIHRGGKTRPQKQIIMKASGLFRLLFRVGLLASVIYFSVHFGGYMDSIDNSVFRYSVLPCGYLYPYCIAF